MNFGYVGEVDSLKFPFYYKNRHTTFKPAHTAVQ